MAAPLDEFDPKRTNETVELSWDFDNLLDADESISSVANWTASVKSGTDANPENIISGSASQDGTKSVQKITGGTDGVEYWLTIQVDTDGGQTLEALAVLPVEDRES